jgi:hypothetical protein
VSEGVGQTPNATQQAVTIALDIIDEEERKKAL